MRRASRLELPVGSRGPARTIFPATLKEWQGQHSEAISLFRQITQQFPDAPEHSFALAKTEQLAQRYLAENTNGFRATSGAFRSGSNAGIWVGAT